jgi:hypothetical protein
MNNFLETGEFEKIYTNSCLLFDGFYQHDKIFVKYKEEIVNYIKKNPELIIKTDKNDSYKVIDFVDYKIKKKYKIVVHLRLEDFLEIAQVIHPNSIKRVIDKLNKEYNNETICFVLNNPKTDIEIRYLQFFTQQYNNIVIETNDVITDFRIMKESTILVCSCSTLSWAAAILSNSLEKVYMPDYTFIHGPHQTCKKPFENTELYSIETCNIIELNKIFDEKLL